VAARIRTGSVELKKLTEEMTAGTVEVLLIFDVNAAYTAPADVNFAEALLALSKTKALTAYLGLYEDETSCRCQWHLPEAHFLESWGDAKNYDGSVTIVQPLIAPLYGGRSKHELLEIFNEGTPRPGYEIVRAYWRGQQPGKITPGEFEQFWEKTLNDGLMPNSSLEPYPVMVKEGWSRRDPSTREKNTVPGHAPGDCLDGGAVASEPGHVWLGGRGLLCRNSTSG
jgi:molybdopterin-containing oxidoreductase family iron-sulfur binding subunit